MPAIDKYLIYDNSASQIGKGVDFARRRLKCHMQKYYRKHGNRGYVLLIDFSKYYDNIIHNEAFEQLKRFVNDDKTLMALVEVIDSFKVPVTKSPDDIYNYKYDSVKNSIYLDSSSKYIRKSVPIGDQTSQVIGIYYPHRIDNYCKIVKGIKFYGRYMDDIYVIHESKEYLRKLLAEIKEIAKSLGIFINDNKTHICRIDKPFHFLQNSYYLTDSGRVVERINKKRIVRMRRKLKKLRRKADDGLVNCEDIANVYRSWIGAYHKVMSKKQIQSMNELYFSLFGGDVA